MCHNSANTEVKLQKSREDQVPHGWASSLCARPQRRLDGTRPAGSESSLQSHRGPGAPVARLLTGICHFCGQKSWSAWLAPCALWGGVAGTWRPSWWVTGSGSWPSTCVLGWNLARCPMRLPVGTSAIFGFGHLAQKIRNLRNSAEHLWSRL